MVSGAIERGLKIQQQIVAERSEFTKLFFFCFFLDVVGKLDNCIPIWFLLEIVKQRYQKLSFQGMLIHPHMPIMISGIN